MRSRTGVISSFVRGKNASPPVTSGQLPQQSGFASRSFAIGKADRVDDDVPAQRRVEDVGKCRAAGVVAAVADEDQHLARLRAVVELTQRGDQRVEQRRLPARGRRA